MSIYSVVKSCLILCDPMDLNLPGSSVHGIFLEEYQSRWPFPSPDIIVNLSTYPECTQMINKIMMMVIRQLV